MHPAGQPRRTAGTSIACSARMTRNGETVSHLDVRVPAGSVSLDGTLSWPSDSSGLVIFAHGSGSSRHSPRNTFVASFLNERGLGTLLVDLLTPGEAEHDSRSAELRFDISLLSERLVAALDWARAQRDVDVRKIGVFGASTGAAAALFAAARRPSAVDAVVSRGGRPDLAGPVLREVRAPTLLIVGSLDQAVWELNVRAARALSQCQLEQVPGAGHLFEEPGALPAVAELALRWFTRELQVDERVVASAR